MNESRRRVTLGLLSAPLVATLAGCDSSNDTQAVAADFHTTMLDKLTAELNDEKTARQLAPFIEEACFNMTPSRVAIDQAHCVIAFAFGNRPNASACCAALYRQKPVPMYVQWEIARFLDSARYPDIPARDVISIEPYWDNDGKLIYLSTDDVVKKIIKDYCPDQDPANLGTAAVIGHRDHVKRCIATCRSNRVASYAPNPINPGPVAATSMYCRTCLFSCSG